MSVAAPQSDRLPLPRTRSFRRAKPQRLWWLAAALALIVNLAVVAGLAQVSRLHFDAPAAPLALTTLRQIAPDPPPSAPAHEPARETDADLQAAAAPIALPSLDLPAAPTAGSLSLPALGSLEASLELPQSLPAFTPIAATPGPALPVAGPAGPPGYDTPAEREGDFSLDRHYPRIARQRGITGSSRIRFTIDDQGRVTTVTVLESTPAGVFDTAAENLARSLRFRPARSGGRAVASAQETTIEWTLR